MPGKTPSSKASAQRPDARPDEVEHANVLTAERFVHAFNDDAWEVVREVVAPDFVFHHPDSGTVQAGPEGMVLAWSSFKAALPDSWHPIPVMIAEGDYVANLLPTYGHFTGEPYHGIPPTGEWLEYGMVNMVRLDEGKLVEAWFGMDSLAEKRQMGVAPPVQRRMLSDAEKASLAAFEMTDEAKGREFDNIAVFGDVVVAFDPPQQVEGATTRRMEVYGSTSGSLTLESAHEFTTKPPYAGDPSVDAEASRALVERWTREVLIDHDLTALGQIASPHILIHPTAMPCEASHYGIAGAADWLQEQWIAFPDLTVADHFTIASGDIVASRWTARGMSTGHFLGLPPTGKGVEYTGTSMYRIDSGRVAEIWETRNTLGIMGQLNPAMAGGHHTH